MLIIIIIVIIVIGIIIILSSKSKALEASKKASEKASEKASKEASEKASKESNEISTTQIIIKYLEPPKNVTVISGNNSCTFSWDPSPNATGYNYVYGVKFPIMPPIDTYRQNHQKMGNVTTYTINNLINDERYYIWIYATVKNVKSIPVMFEVIPAYIPTINSYIPTINSYIPTDSIIPTESNIPDIPPTTNTIIYPPVNITYIIELDKTSVTIAWVKSSNATSYSYIILKTPVKPNVPINNNNIKSPLNYTNPINVGDTNITTISNLADGKYYIWFYGSADDLNSVAVPIIVIIKTDLLTALKRATDSALLATGILVNFTYGYLDTRYDWVDSKLMDGITGITYVTQLNNGAFLMIEPNTRKDDSGLFYFNIFYFKTFKDKDNGRPVKLQTTPKVLFNSIIQLQDNSYVALDTNNSLWKFSNLNSEGQRLNLMVTANYGDIIVKCKFISQLLNGSFILIYQDRYGDDYIYNVPYLNTNYTSKSPYDDPNYNIYANFYNTKLIFYNRLEHPNFNLIIQLKDGSFLVGNEKSQIWRFNDINNIKNGSFLNYPKYINIANVSQITQLQDCSFLALHPVPMNGRVMNKLMLYK